MWRYMASKILNKLGTSPDKNISKFPNCCEKSENVGRNQKFFIYFTNSYPVFGLNQL